MKKFFSLVVVCLMMVSMVACGSTSTSTAQPTATQAKQGAAPAAQAQDEVKALEIKDSGWVVKNGYLYCYIDMFNPNEDIAIKPCCDKLRETLKDTILSNPDHKESEEEEKIFNEIKSAVIDVEPEDIVEVKETEEE